MIGGLAHSAVQASHERAIRHPKRRVFEGVRGAGGAGGTCNCLIALVDHRIRVESDRHPSLNGMATAVAAGGLAYIGHGAREYTFYGDRDGHGIRSVLIDRRLPSGTHTWDRGLYRR